MKAKSHNSPAISLYRFCAQSMKFPTVEWFTAEYKESLFLLLQSLDATMEITQLETAFNHDSNPIESLQIEYTRLFINGVPHVAAPPYGSVYINKTLEGRHTEKTMLFYRNHGYVLKDGTDLPDHIVHQLEFLSLLAEAGDKQAETDFLTSLFLPWFPLFKKQMVAEARHPYYLVIVQLIDFFTMEESEHGI